LRAFVSRRRTLAAPSVTQRQPGWMRPGRILDSRPREEVGTGHGADIVTQWPVASDQCLMCRFV
jgi:hypothetical protein